jgi:hypothetical protein
MSGDMIDDDYEKIKREIVFEKAAKAIKEDPKNWIKQLEDIGLLSDLAFLHEFKNLLSELIGYYLIACDHEQNFKNFEQLALQFYYDTDPDGFDALYELSEKYGQDSDKGKIVREILRRQESEPNSIDF